MRRAESLGESPKGGSGRYWRRRFTDGYGSQAVAGDKLLLCLLFGGNREGRVNGKGRNIAG